MLDEFRAAENLLKEAGLLEVKLPIPLEEVMEFLSKDGLQLRYYSPKDAPVPIKSAASSVDEVLLYQGNGALLFVNQSRPIVRQRFSIFHGIGHFVMPGHRGLNYLTRGCTTMIPNTRRPYERQADRFAAAMNMPPSRFRYHMALLPFGMQTVEKMANRYSASIESAAIHYVSLADAPCALIRLERDYDEYGLTVPDSQLRVRYQVSSPSFPFRIKTDTAIPADSELFWCCSQDEYMAQGAVDGSHLGLGTNNKLWIDCLPSDHNGTVLALIYPGDDEPKSVIDPSKIY